MPTPLEHIAARLGFWHAQRVYARFRRALGRVDFEQQQVLRRVLPLVADSEFGRRCGLRSVHMPADLKRAVPLATYEDYRPYIERVCDGDVGALFSPGQHILMFATTSGTTAQPKRIPVNPAFVADYRRGWNTFGLKLLGDHPRAILRAILQSSSRFDAGTTRGGIPYGAITGLIAQTQKRIVRRFYVGPPEVAHLDGAAARYYTLMRLGIGRDVAFAITASPATLIQMARTASEFSETLIRDVRDGTLAAEIVPQPLLRRTLSAGLRPDPARAQELARLRDQHGVLRPRDYWRVEFVACWTGGSMGYYLPRLVEWWGPVPVRDIGLLASEGRVSIPLEDNTPVGVLDVTSAVFEFIPAEQVTARAPATISPREVEIGRDYAVVLTNASGLLRYRLDDVVRVHGWLHKAPLVEFLYRAGRVASVAGEKLTENQVVAGVQAARQAVGAADFDFALAPCWGDPPYYRLSCTCLPDERLAGAVDRALCEQNEEYDSRRKSHRLGPLRIRSIPVETIRAMDQRLTAKREATQEQYKRPCLFTSPGEDDLEMGIPATQSAAAD
jgi:hypothetical protein